MLRAGHPVGRVATAEAIADFYMDMSSERATCFIGATVMIDGGSHRPLTHLGHRTVP